MLQKKSIKKGIEGSLKGLDDLLGSDNVTDSEKTKLRRKKKQFEGLLEKLKS